MIKKIDLHIHSTFSDGTLTPKEIIDVAKENNVSIISITDHDTTLAYSKDLFNYAEVNNITIIPGVEISTKYCGRGIHILGYNCDLKNKELQKCLSLLKNARINYLINVNTKLNDLGYHLNLDGLKQLPTVTKAHIASDIINNEENKELLLQTFNHMPNKGEFIETIMNENCPAYVEKFSITPVDASKIIKQANGKVVLAHPIAYMHEDNLTIEQIDKLVKEIEADGIEANYIYIDKNNNIFDDSKFWSKYARNNNLFSTIGSDFHSLDNIHPQIGLINTPIEIDNYYISNIINKLNK